MPPTDQPSPALPNPAEQLGAIVSRLYELAGNSQVSVTQRQQLILQAHDLRGDLVTLVSMQFRQETDAYKSAISSLGNVTGDLDQAEQSIQKVDAVVSDADQLAVSVDNLLAEAAKIAAQV